MSLGHIGKANFSLEELLCVATEIATGRRTKKIK